MQLYFSPTVAQRLWARVDKSGRADSCWPYRGARNAKGYGKIYVGPPNAPTPCEYTHRAAYQLTYGPLTPEKPNALHHCDNPPCCNPAHLYAGTDQDNNRDMSRRGRNVMQRNPERVLEGQRRWRAAHPDRHTGEGNPRHILMAAQIPGIRSRYAAGGIRLIDLAAEYGVSINSIWAAIKRRSWSHIP
jgi:hypothetical protein